MGKAHRRKARRSESIENPSVPLDLVSDEAFEAFGSSRSVSGVRVTHRKALGYPAVWRAVNLIAGDVGKLPLQVVKLSGKNKEADPAHPAYRLVRRKPNAYMTAFVFKQTLQAHALTHGNGYAYIERDGAGRPVQLMVLDPCRVVPIIVNAVLWYVYTTQQGQQRKLPADEVLHIKGLGWDGLEGYPVLKIAQDALGAAIAARDHSGRYFKNGARPGGVIQHTKTLTDQARTRMRADWATIHQGLENAHRVAILEEGATYQGFASDARNAQLLETREFDAREVANIFGVPTHKLGDPSKVAYNSLGEENQSYYDDTLSRWLTVWSEECHEKLLAEGEKAKETHTIDFDYQEIQRANLPQQVEFVSKLVGSGVINPDEGRGVFGFNPIPGAKGDRYYVPTTLTPVDEAGTPETPPPAPATPPPEPEPAPRKAPAALRAVVADVAGRMAKRLATHHEKAARSDIAGWLETGIRDHSGVISEAFGPVVALCRELGRAVPDAAGVADQFLTRFSAAVRAAAVDPVRIAAETVSNLLPE
ncbi:MAG TPA: phage portal protein [Urbifossiella sp.]|nr:phage portal protein [Urbifossiella sp.]